MEDKGWGIGLDATRKNLDPRSLPMYLSRDDFNRNYKGRNVICQVGHKRYEVKVNRIYEFDCKPIQI